MNPKAAAAPRDFTLFEVSWEVCNKVGGIHTVISTKAKTLVERLGDDYVTIGPWLLAHQHETVPFEDEDGFEGFVDRCREIGIPVRVGRWQTPGRPLAILVEFNALLEQKDTLLAELWDTHLVDSLMGGWDYVEPVLFGHAAGKVIEQWWQAYLLPRRHRSVAQFHEWMTASGLLYVADNVPSIGTVFTTHATALGRSLASRGLSPEDGLAGRRPEEAAAQLGVQSKHSMETAAARAADAFTTVSDLTAEECELFHGLLPAPVLPNGMDLDVMDELRGGVDRDEARGALTNLAARFLGEPPGDAALLWISGRYEFQNKGIDLLLDALGVLDRGPGRGVVLFVCVPAGNSGVRRGLTRRLRSEGPVPERPLGVCTHNLFDPEHDPVLLKCEELGLDNAVGRRVKVIQVPIYLTPEDRLLGMSYEALLGGADLSCFPSFYEPWGYTPEESLAVGVPTVTTDCAGFGRWARARELTPDDGVYVLSRDDREYDDARDDLAALLETFLEERRGADELATVCRRTAQAVEWSDLIAHYDEAFRTALAAARSRPEQMPAPRVRVPLTIPVDASRANHRPRLFRFDVEPHVPAQLDGLRLLARNVWWTWNRDAEELFADLDPEAWVACRKNPLVLLRVVSGERSAALAADDAYRARVAEIVGRFERYLAEPLAEAEHGAGPTSGHPVAYFCAEYGLHASIPIYSGGLGVLAGDHLKSASDLGVPLLGVGLLYREGFFRQRITAEGEQVAEPVVVDPAYQPVELVRDADGNPVEVELPLPGRRLALRAWRLPVGRVTLYLLDADVERNRPEDRAITHRLYASGHETRLQQELVLGRGGARLLERLGIRPSVFHINEGHAAFLCLERVGRLVAEEGLTFDEAREIVRSGTAFTTHTPVPAGHDRFSEELIRRYFSDAETWLGTSWGDFFALGQATEASTEFNITLLAMSFSSRVNGVSYRHAEVSRRLLHSAYPRVLTDEVPIRGVPNGVHLGTWTNPDVARLLGAAGPVVTGADFESAAAGVDPAALLDVRVRARSRLVAEIRRRLTFGGDDRHENPALTRRMLAGLVDDALYIGFARRFAEYKRAYLLFRDEQRLRALLDDPERPVRVLIAGKAHPNDGAAMKILRRIVELSHSEEYVGRVFVLEDYDMDLARVLVEGVDVWLNTPVPPWEASGTSGMKAAANGGLHLSIADGWWLDGYDGSNGWSIGEGEVLADPARQDATDGATLYALLEGSVVPSFFERAEDGLPADWLERVRRSMATVPPVFNSDRMVAEYDAGAYVPLAREHLRLAAGNHALARKRAAARRRMRRAFEGVRIVEARLSGLAAARVGDVVGVDVEVELGTFEPDDVLVELVLGGPDGAGDVSGVDVVELAHVEDAAQGDGGESGNGAPHGDGRRAWFHGERELTRAGGFAYGVRVRIRGVDEHDPARSQLVAWA